MAEKMTLFLSFDEFELCDVTGRINFVKRFGLAPECADVLLGPAWVDHRQVGTTAGQSIQKRKKLKKIKSSQLSRKNYLSAEPEYNVASFQIIFTNFLSHTSAKKVVKVKLRLRQYKSM